MAAFLRVVAVVCLSRCAAPSLAFQASHGVEIKAASGWRIEDTSDGIRLTAADGAQYLLKAGAFGPGNFGDPVRSEKLQAIASRLAFGVAPGASYAGVKSIAAPSGMSAAVFKYRGSLDQLVEIYYIGNASTHVGLTTVRSGMEDHAYDLGEMVKSIRISGVPAISQETRPQSPPTSVVAEPQSASPGTETKVTEATKDPFSVPTSEVYTGKVNSSDLSFELRIRDGNVATAVWDKTVGTGTRWQGTFNGKEGNYLVKLDRVSAKPSVGGRLIVAVRSQGGAVSGKWVIGGENPIHDMADLKLTEVVEHGNVPFKKSPSKATNNSASRANNRTSQRNRSAVNRMMNRNRRRPF